jgi:hypothetical protein
MNAIDAIRINLETAEMVCGSYLGDLTDDDAMKRPHPDCNHINWQIGHLIGSDHMMCSGCLPDSLPPLPDGFSEKYSKEAAGSDNPDDFIPKSQLMEIHAANRKAIMEALSAMDPAKLEQAGPESMRAYAPTVGATFNMIGAHWLMHAGQWVVVRRELGRDIVI